MAKRARPLFDGETYVEARDRERLACQLVDVWKLMSDKKWRTLANIAGALGYPDGSIPSISARLRDLRKDRFGAYRVRSRYVRRGLWEYRVLPPLPPEEEV